MMFRRLLRPLVVACLTMSAIPVSALPARAASAVPARTRLAPSTGVHAVSASGDFAATLDFDSLRLQPVGSRCLLTVSGTLTLAGTLLGTATGSTAAFEDAPCTDVAANPPGTFADVFRFTGTFSGTIAGRATAGALVYAGRTAPGGAIDAVMVVTGGLTGLLRVQAVVGVGGTYRGVVVQP
jgi:hypothetical protein